MKKKVTIQDIADALGISRNTVSKAINNSDGLADATREKILQKAVEMGYKQFSYVSAFTSLSRQLPQEAQTAPGFQGEIALFTTMFLGQSHFASLMLDKFQQEISQLGYTLNTHRVTRKDLKTGSLPITFLPERTSAIVCIEVFDPVYADMVCSLGLPVLFVDGPVKQYGTRIHSDQLCMDNISETSRFIHSLLDRGYKRIGFLGDYNHCKSFFERYFIFRATMHSSGVPVDERFIIRDTKPAHLTETLRELGELPDVFLCANDFAAFDAMQALSALGKSVPKDVMLCGFDDSAESRTCHPPLTTIHIHTQIMAYEAVHLLMSRIKEPSLDFRIVYTQTDLIERESTNR
ncbi:MAG: LacI family DNA-binding transcriptional regulator [Oscillospiraceae bacterium]|nr:LacI family DNA-binding transcriptional regulator [Oscillospiraceae bacterium]